MENKIKNFLGLCLQLLILAVVGIIFGFAVYGIIFVPIKFVLWCMVKCDSRYVVNIKHFLVTPFILGTNFLWYLVLIFGNKTFSGRDYIMLVMVSVIFGIFGIRYTISEIFFSPYLNQRDDSNDYASLAILYFIPSVIFLASILTWISICK